MIKAFFEDDSGFKKSIFLSLFFVIVFIFGAFAFIDQYSAITLKNEKAKAMTVAKNNWLKEFDYKTAEKLGQKLLKPVKEKDVEIVQKAQLQILQHNKVSVGSVRQDKPKTINKSNLKAVKYEVMLESQWENLVKALNEFEKSNLVVITGLEISPNVTSNVLTTNLTYNIYFQ